MLITTLSGLAPFHRSYKDKWGWGRFGFFTAAQGFSSLQAPHPSLLSPTLWKDVWSPLSLPKVNLFTWLLMHKMDLIGENLNKQGFHGLFRCCFCNSATETSDHIFGDCVFTQIVWELVLQGLKVTIPSQMAVVPLFIS